MMPLVNRKAAEERRGDQGITRKLLRYVGRDHPRVDAETGQRVVAQNSALARARYQNKGHGASAPEILIRLLLEIVIEPAIAARESLAVVSVAKRLDNPGRVRHLLGRSPFVTTGRLAKELGRRGGVEERAA